MVRESANGPAPFSFEDLKAILHLDEIDEADLASIRARLCEELNIIDRSAYGTLANAKKSALSLLDETESRRGEPVDRPADYAGVGAVCGHLERARNAIAEGGENAENEATAALASMFGLLRSMVTGPGTFLDPAVLFENEGDARETEAFCMRWKIRDMRTAYDRPENDWNYEAGSESEFERAIPPSFDHNTLPKYDEFATARAFLETLPSDHPLRAEFRELARAEGAHRMKDVLVRWGSRDRRDRKGERRSVDVPLNANSINGNLLDTLFRMAEEGIDPEAFFGTDHPLSKIFSLVPPQYSSHRDIVNESYPDDISSDFFALAERMASPGYDASKESPELVAKLAREWYVPKGSLTSRDADRIIEAFFVTRGNLPVPHAFRTKKAYSLEELCEIKL